MQDKIRPKERSNNKNKILKRVVEMVKGLCEDNLEAVEATQEEEISPSTTGLGLDLTKWVPPHL